VYISVLAIAHPVDPHDLPPEIIEVTPDPLAIEEYSELPRAEILRSGSGNEKGQNDKCGEPTETLHVIDLDY
jgi:hypothetical protein